MSRLERTGEVIFRGIPVSSGVCRGKLFVLTNREQHVPQVAISNGDVAGQLQRFEQALIQTHHQLLEIQKVMSKSMDQEASIFDAHLLLLQDPMLIDEVRRSIEKEKFNAEYAFQTVVNKYSALLGAIEDEYLRERKADLKDVSSRVLDNLMGRHEENQLASLTEPCIIVSHDLTPSMTAELDKKVVLGFATDIGSRTSHTAIMARAMQIPAVVALREATKEMVTGQYALLDGFNGVLIVNPTDKTLFEYGQLVQTQVTLQEKLRDLRETPAVSLDGNRITLSANVEHAADAEAVRACGAEGVGLFRTEYLYLGRQDLPSEEEQYQAYRQMAEKLHPQPVVIRTLDLGGDKFLTSVGVPPETSSFYGWRAIRFCLHNPEIFRAQLRAILRASTLGNVKLMYPMISGLAELKQANALVEECKAELRKEGKPFDDRIDIGAMIEIPAAALAADALARHVKFFSIGTNDLIQYSLAVDRMNEKVAHLYEPTHPGVLRLIKTTVEAAHKHGLWVGVCGEMAGDPAMTALLLGLGVDELSAAPPLVPQVKFLIRRLKMEEAKRLADFALQCESGADIQVRAQQLAQDIAPSLFDGQPRPAVQGERVAAG